MVTILMRTMVTTSPKSRTNLLEKILTAVIVVLTKEHYCNVNGFNNKLFFKLLFNILYVDSIHSGSKLGRLRIRTEHHIHAADHRPSPPHPSTYQVPWIRLRLAAARELKVPDGPPAAKRRLELTRLTRKYGPSSTPSSWT